jgi:putative SOS response-associated peptidase YedK
MPIILNEDSFEPWLAPDITEREAIRNMVRHIDAGLIERWAVSTAVNKPAEGQGEELINPA